MKKIIIPTIIIAVLGITAYVMLNKKSPLNTIAKIEQSMNEHDWVTFQEYVDIDSIYNSVVGQSLSDTDNKFAKGLGVLMADKMKDVFKTKLKEAIEDTGKSKENLFSKTIKQISESRGDVKMINHGKIAELVISTKTGLLDIPTSIAIKFSDDGEKYILSAIDNEKLKNAQKIEKLLLEDHYNLPAEKEIKLSVKVKSIEKHEGCSNYIGKSCFSKLIMNTSKVANLTDKKITEVGFYIYPNETTYKNKKYVRYGTAKNINAKSSKIVGKKTGWKYNQFIESDKVFMKAKSKSLHYEIDEVKFSDGRILKKGKFLYVEHIANLPSIKEVLERRKEYGLTDNHGYESL